MKYLCLPLALVVLPIALTNCNKVHETANHVAASGDYTLAKNTFEGLTRGDVSVAKDIDWDILMVPKSTALPSGDFGSAYVQIPTETEKMTQQKTFILDFASSYQKSGGATYSNWKVSYHDDHKTEVTAESGPVRLILTVTTRDGKDRLSAINVQG